MTITGDDCTVLDALIREPGQPKPTAQDLGAELPALGAEQTIELLQGLRARGLAESVREAGGREFWIATSEGGAERDAYRRDHPL